MSAMRAIVMLGVAGIAGCTKLSVDFTCKDDTDCTSESGQPGVCEPNNRCGVPDASCPNLYRYTDYAGALSGQCTPSFDCIAELRAGADMTCARTSGAVSCWGGGISMPTPLALPADLPASNVVEIALGGLGMTSTGGTAPAICLRSMASDVYCAATLQQTPAKIAQLKASDISIGANHACAVTTAGQVACWGANNSGQIGDGSNTARSMPVPVTGGLTNVKRVAAGFEDTCAVTMDGTVWCWGSDDHDQLGRKFFPPPSDACPAQIPNADVGVPVQAMAVALGDRFACALRNDATLLCWGDNQHDELGDDRQMPVDSEPLPSDTISSPTPGRVHMRAAVSFSQVSSGGGHSCGVDSNHQLWCWGENQQGQSTAASSSSLQEPTLVDNGSGLPIPADNVAVGRQHTCASSTGRGVMCWGSNASGQIGSSTTGATALPTAVPLLCP
jgi:alpha-tubulin suppressor-like RCC1 family protein